jgi:hypothetical protein
MTPRRWWDAVPVALGRVSPQNDVLRPAGKGKLGPAGESAPIVGFDVTVTDDAGCKTMLGFLD